MARYRRVFSVSTVLFAIAAAFVGATAPALAQDLAYRVDPVAMTGEPAPGTGGLNFSCFDWLYTDLGDSGVVAFVASTVLCDPYGLNPNDDHGIWAGTPGSLALAARMGDPAPGGTAQTFTALEGAFVNVSGDLAIQARLDTYSTSFGPDKGIWIRSAGILSLLTMSGDPAPGTAGLSFTSVGLIGFNDLGVATFTAYAGDTPNSLTGIWRGTPGLLETVVLSGDPAPGAAGLYFDRINHTSTNSDFTAFWATTTDPDPSLAEGIWNAGPAGIDLVARLGDQAPGAGGRVFRAFQGYGLTPAPIYQDDYLDPYRFDAFVVNQTGDVVFTAYIDPLDQAEIYSDAGLWIRDATGLSLVALTDDVAPGTAAEPFLYFNHINLNAAGQVAFDASLDIADSGRDHGIWVGLPGSLNLVVREGDPAPGTAGETFDSLVMGPSLNDSGEIAFFAKLRESGTYGLWAAAADGSLSLIARVGETVAVKSGDYRTVGTIMPVYGGLGSYSWFNAFNGAGQLVFASTFTDGTQAVLLGSPISTSPNQLPVANAGPDQAIVENNTAVLNGTASHDPDGTILSFVWSIGGVQIASEPTAVVGPLAVGVHTVTLTVTDRNGASVSDDMILTVFANLPPVVNAGPDRTVDYTQLVTFDGTGTTDPEGDALTYVWSVDYCLAASGAGPGGPAPTETAPGIFPNCPDFATGPTPTDGPFVVGAHTVTLTVTDSHGASATDEMILTVTNDPPVADAGLDQTVQTLDSVTLNGSGSSDPENDIKFYTWSIDGTLLNASGPTPVVGPFDAGVYTITLTVSDGGGGEATDQMVLTVLNRAPVADAGPDRTANHAQTVTLAGSGSDPEGSALSYAWTLNGLPIAAVANPTVGPFEIGVHTLTLTVTDDHGATATDSMSVTVTNAPPLANAGPDQTVNHAQTVTLDGSGSSDPEGGALTYTWSVDGVQAATGASPVIGPFAVGIHTVTLTVTDDHGATATDNMVVTVVNEAPVADAGPDQTVSIRRRTTLVTLDGSASTDPEGGTLSYVWAKDGQTVGTGAALQLRVPAGVHLFTLTVTDDHGATASDSVIVTATKGGKGS